MSTDLATLAKLDPAALVAWGKERLDAAGTGLEVKKIKATAAAVAAYQRAVGAGKEAQQAAVEVTVRCERRLQQELGKLQKNKGGRPAKTGPNAGPVSMAELGVDKRRAHEASVLAEVTPEQFEAGITALRERGELTQGAMLNLMGQAIAGGLSPEEIEASIMAEKARRPKPEPLKLNFDLSPIATAIYALEDASPWSFEPEACAATVDRLMRRRILALARSRRDWLDRFITTVEEQARAEEEADPGRDAA